MTAQINYLKHRVDSYIDVIDFVFEALLKKIPHRKMHLIARYHLPRYRYRKPLLEVYLTCLWLYGLRDETKERALARAILAHECRLRATAEAEGDIVEHHLLRSIFIRHIFKSKDNFGCHFKKLPYVGGNANLF